MSPRRSLLLDLQGAQDPRNGDRGIGRVVAELAIELDARPGVVAALLLNPLLPVPDHLPAAIIDSPQLRWNTPEAIDEALAAGPVAYWAMSPFEMGSAGPIAVPDHVLRADVPLVVTLHDLIPLHDPDRLLPGSLRRRHEVRTELVRAADLVLCVSEHTRADAIHRLHLDPARCVVIGNGAASRFRPAAPDEDPAAVLAAALPDLSWAHVLCVSGGDDRKNTRRLISAWGRLPAGLRSRHQLVVSCDLDAGIGRDWTAHAAAVGLQPGEVLLTGFVADDVLVALYQRASLVVMPSLDEGYGLPVAEAIASDRPVITSDAAALPEILDLPESAFDPRDEAAMSRAVERGLSDEAFRTRLLEAGRRAAPSHRWPAVAERVLHALTRLDPDAPGRRPAPRRDRRLRVALVGPLPPVASGVAEYNGRVVDELARLVDLDVLTPCGGRGSRGEAPYHRLPAQSLGRTVNPAGYHAIVYTVGNSYHHVATRELALRFPGVVWLHDARLAALYRNVAEGLPGSAGEEWMRDLLRREYGERLGDHPDGARIFDREWVHQHGVFLSQELVRSARGVVVNSHLAERLVRLDQGPDAPMPPLLRLEHAVAAPPPDGAASRTFDPPLIATFGNVDWIKAPDRILDAVATIAPETGARLAVVGTLANVGRGQLEAYATRLGIADRVDFTGAVDDAEWWRMLRTAAIAVQLRRLTNAEASGAIAGAQAVGTPVVTNIVNAGEEYPPDAVLAIDNDLPPGGLEGALMRLLRDRAEWERHSAAGLEHARRCTFTVVVEELVGWLDAAIVSGSAAL